MAKRKKAAPAEETPQAPAPVPTPAAPVAEVNKSEEIRKLFRETPKMKVSEVVKALAARNIAVKAGMVYVVKSAMKRKGRKARAQAGATPGGATSMNGRRPGRPAGNDAVATIVKVRGWADEVGGLRQLKELVGALSGDE